MSIIPNVDMLLEEIKFRKWSKRKKEEKDYYSY